MAADFCGALAGDADASNAAAPRARVSRRVDFTVGLLRRGRRGRGHNPDVIAHGYFGTVGGDPEDGRLRPARVYSPKKRMVAIASKETGTHIPFSVANCIVR